MCPHLAVPWAGATWVGRALWCSRDQSYPPTSNHGLQESCSRAPCATAHYSTFRALGLACAEKSTWVGLHAIPMGILGPDDQFSPRLLPPCFPRGTTLPPDVYTSSSSAAESWHGHPDASWSSFPRSPQLLTTFWGTLFFKTFCSARWQSLSQTNSPSTGLSLLSKRWLRSKAGLSRVYMREPPQTPLL